MVVYGGLAWMFFCEKELLSSHPISSPRHVKDMGDCSHMQWSVLIRYSCGYCNIAHGLFSAASLSSFKFYLVIYYCYIFGLMSCSWWCHCCAPFSLVVDDDSFVFPGTSNVSVILLSWSMPFNNWDIMYGFRRHKGIPTETAGLYLEFIRIT